MKPFISMKLILPFLILLVTACSTKAQSSYLDSLHVKLSVSKEDTNKVYVLSSIADYYGFNKFDSSIYYAHQILDLSKFLKFDFGTYLGLRSLFFAYNCQGNYPKALEVTLKGQAISEKIKKKGPFRSSPCTTGWVF